MLPSIWSDVCSIIPSNISQIWSCKIRPPTLPTNVCLILEPQNPWIDTFYFIVQERRATDYKAPKLQKGSSGFHNFEPQYFPVVQERHKTDLKASKLWKGRLCPLKQGVQIIGVEG